MPKIQYQINNFDKGVINSIEAHSIAPGASPDSLNFLTMGDRVEFRRGQRVLGSSISGSGRVQGIHVAYLENGNELLIVARRNRKIEYYDTTTSDFVEISTNLIPAVASGEDIAFANYNNLAGHQVLISSPNSGLWQIFTASKASVLDVYDAAKNYKGYLKIKTNRTRLWQRNESPSTLYLSHIDALIDEKTDVTGEAIGALGSQTYSGTLAFKSGGTKRYCFAVTFAAAGGETFTDNRDGTLTGSAGGTGTINYATGAYSVTFNAVTAGAVTSAYSWHDATDKGIADFTFSATRVASEGDFFNQGDRGDKLQNDFAYRDTDFCMHTRTTWALTLTADDTNASNLIYRENVGIPNWLAGDDTGEGIYYVDSNFGRDPKIRVLQLESGSTEVIPIELSAALDLSDYGFDQAAVKKWGDYILVACKAPGASHNNRLLVYNLRWKSFDILDYNVSCMEIYNGALVAGDSISNNVLELFSGLDDLESTINAYYTTGELNLSIEALKKVKEVVIEGRIQTTQSAKVYIADDNGGWVEVGEIDGAADYVDRGQHIYIGAVTVGKNEVGGGGDGIEAYHYTCRIKLYHDKFYRRQVRVVPQAIGWFDITGISFVDIRIKQQKLPQRYR